MTIYDINIEENICLTNLLPILYECYNSIYYIKLTYIY